MSDKVYILSDGAIIEGRIQETEECTGITWVRAEGLSWRLIGFRPSGKSMVGNYRLSTDPRMELERENSEDAEYEKDSEHRRLLTSMYQRLLAAQGYKTSDVTLFI